MSYKKSDYTIEREIVRGYEDSNPEFEFSEEEETPFTLEEVSIAQQEKIFHQLRNYIQEKGLPLLEKAGLNDFLLFWERVTGRR